MNCHLLIIDDEEGMRVSLKNLLENSGFVVSVAESARRGLSILQSEHIDLILCDIVMPDMNGLIFLSQVHRNVPVVMITAYASVETARKAFKMGARDYLVKPFDFDELLVVVRQNMLNLHSNTSGELVPDVLLDSDSTDFQEVIRLADRFSPTDLPVLIEGESGTGKEVIANYIHSRSRRSNGPFIKLNCAAIPETLLESELFGYEKGAFTGAVDSKVGLLEQANHGTFFFDEIGDMPMLLQAKLLRFMQNLSFVRLGGTKESTIDCRIIAASNRKMYQLVKDRKFREDLYYRINGVQMLVPALRERRTDIPGLADFFMSIFLRKYRKDILGIIPETLSILVNYEWPGNIRELKNCMERAVVICDTPSITTKDLPDSIINYDPGQIVHDPRTHDFRRKYMRDLVLSALHETNGNKAEAARALKVTRRTLYNWISEYDIHDHA